MSGQSCTLAMLSMVIVFLDVPSMQLSNSWNWSWICQHHFFLLLSLHLALGMSTSTYTRVTSSKSTVDERTREHDGHWSGPRQHFSLTKMLIRSFLGPLALPNLSTFSLSILRPKQLPKQSLSHQKCCFSIFNQDLTPLLLVAVNHSAQCAQSESCKRNMVYQLELISHNIQYPVLSSASIFS